MRALFLSLVVATVTMAQEPSVAGRTKTEWLKLLKEAEAPRARSGALAALAIMEPKDRAIYDAIGDALLSDKVEAVRIKAAESAGVILLGPRPDTLLLETFGKAMAKDASESVRLKTLTIAREMKKEEIGRLGERLSAVLSGDTSANVRAAAASALAKAGDRAKSALNVMIEALKDSDANVRATTADAIGRIGDEAKVAVPRLVPLLQDKDAGARAAAAFALGRIGPEAASAVPEMAKALESDTDENVRKEIARSLNILGLDAKAAVPALGKALREDKSAEVRQQSALALGKMRGDAASVATQMVQAMQLDKDKIVRVYVVHAIADALGADLKKHVKDLAKQLVEDPEGDVRLAIIQELGALGPDAAEALPALNRAVADVQLPVREEAKRAIKRVMEKK